MKSPLHLPGDAYTFIDTRRRGAGDLSRPQALGVKQGGVFDEDLSGAKLDFNLARSFPRENGGRQQEHRSGEGE
jgi:hypothetical protein